VRPLYLAMLLTTMVMFAPAPAAAAEPAGYEYFHTYAEVKAELDATESAHPGIARVFSIGNSYQGRPIWAIKISDDVGQDENEPEIFINAQIHARERAPNELALYIVGLLTDNYGANDELGQRVTDIVNTREIFIVPTVNPDGAEFDIKGGQWHEWRKNRQPIPDSRKIGIDLNRQFGYMWACCKGSSFKPRSSTYHGPSPWYAPEVVRYRDFVNSRVIGGKQQLSVILSLHSAGRLVLWPYSYTKQDIPAEMPVDDHNAFVALGTQLASLNGYRPEQGSDLYIVDGDQDDWAYHEHGIFTFTVEMTRGAVRRYYPTRDELARDLADNRPAVLMLLEQADCPYRAAGLASSHC
jgi:carboxypeptidase T